MQQGLPCGVQCEPIQRLVCSSGFDLRPAVLRNVREIEILENTAHRLALCQSMRCFFDRHQPRQIGCVGFVVRGRVLVYLESNEHHYYDPKEIQINS